MTIRHIQKPVVSLVSVLALITTVIVALRFSSFPGSRSRLEEIGTAATDTVSSKVSPPGTQKYHVVETPRPQFKEPFCSRCHPAPPHEGSGSHQAFLNHHVSRVHCLVCHGQEFISSGENLSWKDGVLWPRSNQNWLTAAVEEDWREKATRKGTCFKIGQECGNCHRSGGFIDWYSLGYEKDRIAGLQNLNTFITASKDQKWFFPAIR